MTISKTGANTIELVSFFLCVVYLEVVNTFKVVNYVIYLLVAT